MPYRRLPNTDAARIRAMKNAIEKSSTVPYNDSAVPYALLTDAKYFLTTFQNGVRQTRSTYSLSAEKGSNLSMLQKRTKMYVSHFIQVLNMAIQRGELPSSVRELYGLTSKKLPKMDTAEDLLEVGRKIIDGETKRISTGASMITYPKISMVRIEYDKFANAARTNDFRIDNDKRTSEYMHMLREKADGIILALWNEIESHFAYLEPEERRKRCAEYGVSYVFRKSEMKQDNSELE